MGGRTVRRRFWAEAVLAGIGALLALVTAVAPDWIERVGGGGGDAGSGSTERAIVLLFLAAAVVLAGLASVEWRRPLQAEVARHRSGRTGRTGRSGGSGGSGGSAGSAGSGGDWSR
ncbi:hypothetical protein BJ986_002315 [Phycicoccus badiiscoriae]|uniref:Uncharacterized protein n=1 Tax=Pedococcus badiiscoriae TaxID=642776 RepID=A0A852WFS6_9MICO|nr:ABC transporter permease [Pedococcus badiiscoriae]NYG07828.1 hypothetical protein [Pedococcus badiiscoriae]